MMNRLVEKYGLYCLAIVVIILNASLAFDNVVWGDEAFSGNTIRGTNLYGIFERIYYWDSHPPLYYYWLRFMASIFGYKTYVYHFASIVPFVVGVIMAVTVFKKELGKIPAAFFIVLSGLSAPCAEYNLEIRMYALVFMELLICAFCSYKIMETGHKKSVWVILTIFSVAAAYTHYFGLVVSGILLFVTTLFNFLRSKKCFYGINSILTYIALYIPWLVVFFMQAKRVGNGWWLEEIAGLSVLTNVIFCGENLKKILMAVTVILSLVIFVKESEMIYLSLEEDKDTVSWKFMRPSIKNWSLELYAILLFWTVIILTIIFTYVASVILNPITVARYMYPLVPLTLFILMLCIRRILAYGRIKWGSQEYGFVQEEKREKQIFLFNTESILWKRLIFALITGLFMIIMVIALFDFKYYRSVSKTQEVQTQKIISIIGEPNEDAVFTATGVKHLSWTVLPYYYPANKVLDCLPNEVDSEVDDIWAFVGFAMSDEAIAEMEANGYSMEVHMDLWLGKYGCNLYHFYR